MRLKNKSMPTCNKCGEHFPNYINVNGIKKTLYNRKYCLLCSPYNKHNTSKLETFPNDEKRIVCSKCRREYIYDKKKGHCKTVCNSCTVHSKRIEIKIKMIEYKGGKCSVCGYDKCVASLEFHHLRDKKFSFGGNHTLRWEKIKEELDKCVLVCSNCHAEIHWNEGKHADVAQSVAAPDL